MLNKTRQIYNPIKIIETGMNKNVWYALMEHGFQHTYSTLYGRF